ncbi:hypothetical protein QJQ45_021678, partial [Haematococcus lacustris]
SGCRACLQSGKVVVVLTGRFAGKKAVIVRNFDDGTTSRPYGHALVVGLQKEPRKVTKRQTAKKQAKKSSLKTFIKTINYTHLMPTRYTLAVDFKNVTTDVVDDATKKVEARKVNGKDKLMDWVMIARSCLRSSLRLERTGGSSPSCVSERPYLSTLIRQPSQGYGYVA